MQYFKAISVLEGIYNLVSIKGSTVHEIINAFIEAINDYKELCLKTGKSYSTNHSNVLLK